MKKHETTPPDWSELNRAAGAGYDLADARRRFDDSATEAMLEFAIANRALLRAWTHEELPTIYTCFDVSHTAFAHFITLTRIHWQLEDDPGEEHAGQHKKHPRTRAEDIHDGFLTVNEDPKPIDHIIQECARVEFDHNRNLSKQLLCISLGWTDDLTHCRTNPRWARTQGIFPGAQTAPALAGMMNRLAAHLTPVHPKQAAALKLAAHAATQLREAANDFGRACCAEYEYNLVLHTHAAEDDAA